MEQIKFKIIEYSHLSVRYGFLFEVDNRQFALSYTDTCVNVHDLYIGGRVIWFQYNDILKQTDEQLIEFAKFYISNIDKKQFDIALERVKEDYPFISFPVNDNFKL